MEASPHGLPSESRGAEFAELLASQPRGYAVIFMDEHGVIDGWSAAAAYVTGWNAVDAVGRPLALIFTDDDRARGLDEHELAAAAKLGATEDERWHLRKDGSVFWSSGICMALTGPKRGFVKIFKDATHLRARSKLLENETQQLKLQLAARDQILGTVAHELRNPLSPLKASLAVLSKGEVTPERARVLAIIDRQIVTMERLVEDLVDVERGRHGKMTLSCKVVDIRMLLEHALEAARPAAECKGVALSCSLPPKPIEAEVDAGRIQQVVANLLSNAIRFTPSGGFVTLVVNVDQTHILITVRDNGSGIGPEMLPRIFDMFTQAPGADSGRGSGLGIGLAVVKEIVVAHQGSVEVRSAGVDKGAEFIARVPLRQPSGPGPEPILARTGIKVNW